MVIMVVILLLLGIAAGRGHHIVEPAPVARIKVLLALGGHCVLSLERPAGALSIKVDERIQVLLVHAWLLAVDCHGRAVQSRRINVHAVVAVVRVVGHHMAEELVHHWVREGCVRRRVGGGVVVEVCGARGGGRGRGRGGGEVRANRRVVGVNIDLIHFVDFASRESVVLFFCLVSRMGEVADFCTHLFERPLAGGAALGACVRVPALQLVPPFHAFCVIDEMRSQ